MIDPNEGRANSARNAAGPKATFVIWWAVLALVWLLLVDTFDPEELVVGALAAAVAAALAVAVHRRGYIRFWPSARWAREAPNLLRDVVIDTGLLGAALWRRLIRGQRVQGEMIRVPFHHGGDNGRDGARRALVNFAVSLTPNSYVVDIDPEGDSLLVHRLVDVPLDRILLREQERFTSSLPPLQGDDS